MPANADTAVTVSPVAALIAWSVLRFRCIGVVSVRHCELILPGFIALSRIMHEPQNEADADGYGQDQEHSFNEHYSIARARLTYPVVSSIGRMTIFRVAGFSVSSGISCKISLLPDSLSVRPVSER